MLKAGDTTTVRYLTSAPHVGDCAFYLSYDNDAPRAQQRWFKIANIPNCKEFSSTDIELQLPPWLPPGDAILRWDWYGLHLSPPEFFVQCSDVTVVATAAAVPVAQVAPRVTAFELYEEGGWGTAFRSPYNGGSWSNGPSAGFFMSGIACANGFDENNCACTAPGTAGRGGICGGAPSSGLSPPPPPAIGLPTDAASPPPMMAISSPPPPPPTPRPPPPQTASPTASASSPPMVAVRPPPPPPLSDPNQGTVGRIIFQDLVFCFADCFDNFRDARRGIALQATLSALSVEEEPDTAAVFSESTVLAPLVVEALQEAQVPVQPNTAAEPSSAVTPLTVGIIAGFGGLLVGVLIAGAIASCAMSKMRRTFREALAAASAPVRKTYSGEV